MFIENLPAVTPAQSGLNPAAGILSFERGSRKNRTS